MQLKNNYNKEIMIWYMCIEAMLLGLFKNIVSVFLENFDTGTIIFLESSNNVVTVYVLNSAEAIIEDIMLNYYLVLR